MVSLICVYRKQEKWTTLDAVLSLLLSRFQPSKEQSQKVTDLIAVSPFKISLKGEAYIGKPHSKLTPTFLSRILGLRITAKSLF